MLSFCPICHRRRNPLQIRKAQRRNQQRDTRDLISDNRDLWNMSQTDEMRPQSSQQHLSIRQESHIAVWKLN